MDSELWERVQAIFHDALAVAPEQRAKFVQSVCGDDQGLAAKVLLMLQRDGETSFLDRDIIPLVDQVLGEPEPLPFETVGPYRLLYKIGEGGMGLVYFAEHEYWCSYVAVKFPRDAWISRDRMERFEAEQRLLAQLTHPSIARIYDGGTLPSGTPWFAMEYVNGHPITEYCERAVCDTKQKLQLFRTVCEAVQYAHTLTIVHRDLKPSNILVTGAGAVKLLDFGIAKQVENSREESFRTRTGHRAMTLAYAAPEQVSGNRIGTYTDVYSLGVLLYELLTRQLPFDGNGLTPSQAEQMISTRQPEKPSSAIRRATAGTERDSGLQRIGKSAWSDLDVLILTAMHKDVAQRYASVDALKRDVDHFLSGEPLEARADTLWYRLGKFARRRRVPILSAAAVMALIIALVSFFVIRLARARDAALEESARTRRVQKFMTDLFDGGDQELGPSKDLRVLTLLDRGLKKAHDLNGDPQEQGELYETLGTIFDALGDNDKASRLLETALKDRILTFGPDSAPVAQTTMELAMHRIEEAKFTEAEALARRALNIAEHQVPIDDIVIARDKAALARVCMRTGKEEEAIKLLNEALPIQDGRPTETDDYGASMTLLVSAYINLGQYAHAEPLCRRVVARDERTLSPDHANTATDLMNLGSVQSNLCQYAEAERTFRRALAIYTAWYPKGHPEIADAKRMLAQTLEKENRLDEAQILAREALIDFEKAYGSMHPKVAFDLGILGRIAVRQGDVAGAQKAFERESNILETTDKQYWGYALGDLGALYMFEKDYRMAEDFNRRAVMSLTDFLPAEHPRLGLAKLKLGETLMAEGRFQDAQILLQASYRIWKQQPNRAVSMLRSSGPDLVRVYQALNKPEQMKNIRAEIATS